MNSSNTDQVIKVTLAAKMENSGKPDKIQMTLKSHQLLSARFPEFKCSPRGGVKLEVFSALRIFNMWT